MLFPAMLGIYWGITFYLFLIMAKSDYENWFNDLADQMNMNYRKNGIALSWFLLANSFGLTLVGIFSIFAVLLL
jgi:hypothetical protein